MTDLSLKLEIQQALAMLPQASLFNGTANLFAILGYSSDRRVTLEDTGAATFLSAFNSEARIHHERAKIGEWAAIEMMFQYTGAELRAGMQSSLFDQQGFDAQTYQSFLFFALELRGATYNRSELATITREINKLFLMPVSVAFRYGDQLTLAIVTHRPNRRDEGLDVLEKVALIHGVRLQAAHRAHIEILVDLALPNLMRERGIAGFDDLQRGWVRALDTAELNRRFYREIADWYFWAVDNVTFPEGAGARPDVRNATSVIRLLTRLIFVWFLKERNLVPEALFRRADVEQLLHTPEPDEGSYYRAILQNLFFATLNQEMSTPERPANRRFRNDGQHYNVTALYRYRNLLRQPDALLQLLASVPFLNGGLFECLDKSDEQGKVTRIDGFSDRPDNPLHIPNRLFFSERHAEDLNRAYGTRGKRYAVRGLVDILDSYKFTVAENTPIEQEVALDPELLGQVFENLLAAYNPETETTARKETGSFYTPRSVVGYMVDESLVLAFCDYMSRAAPLIPAFDGDADRLDKRLRDLLAYSDAPHDFSSDEVGHLIAAIDTLTVLDPACGSGAFPMGVLQKLVYVLSKLDPGNRRWKERQLARARSIPDPEAREAAETAIEEAFGRNELDYGRKLFLIENCIYGVDIQPIAVQIAKLRCFIALIVDQRVENNRPNRGVRALPNLETKFVAANALRALSQPQQLQLLDPEIEQLQRILDEVRSRHFNARTPATKRKYRDQDRDIRAQLAVLLQRGGFSGESAALLAGWDPYDQNATAAFFDADWMFGIDNGFDIVIANPPYVRQEQIREQKLFLQKQFPEAYTGTADLYVYFFARALQLLRRGGVLTFITSNKYFRAGYGQKLRSLLADTTVIQQVIDFGDAPVFTAIAYPSIIVAQKGGGQGSANEDGHALLALNWDPTMRLADFPQIIAGARRAISERIPGAPLVLQRSLGADGWRLEGAATQRMLDKLRRAGQPLGDYVNGRFYYGIKTGLNEAFVVNRATHDTLVAEHPSSADLLKPFLRGRDVKRWRVQFAEQYLIKIESSENKQHLWSGKPNGEAERIFARTYPAIHQWFEPMRGALMQRSDQGAYFWELRSCAYWHEFQQPKILYPDIYEHQSFTFSVEEYYSGNTTYFIPTNEKWLTGVLNSSVIEWFYSQISSRIRGGYLRAFSDYMRQIPIPAAGSTTAIERTVTQILTAKAVDAAADVRVWEQEINERVYALYGLRPDEIQMIEESVRATT